MKKTLALLLPLLFAGNAFAAPPSTKSVDELLKITSTDQMVEGTMAGMDNMMKGYLNHLMEGQQLAPDAQARMAKAADVSRHKAMVAIADEMDWKKVRPLFEQSYQQTFSQDEIDGILAFYKTPAGAAFQKKMPMAQQQTFAIMHQRLDPLMKKVQIQLNSDMQAAAARESKHP